MKGFRVLILLSAACLLVPCAAHGVTVTVDASSVPTGQIGFRLGHNVPYYGPAPGGVPSPCAYLWSVGGNPLDASAIKTDALAAIQYAGTLRDGFVRFPGGDPSEFYHWRRGVGYRLIDGRTRPLGEQGRSNAFGTDDLMMFIAQMNAAGNGQPARTAVPLLTVNWWEWNNTEDPVYQSDWPDKGKQEAANWVEYCNGEVTPQIIDSASTDHWAPTKFIKDYLESTAPDAEETAEHTGSANSWCSWEDHDPQHDNVPAGYFAWLRWHNLTTHYNRGASDPIATNGYGVKYWEVGNETYKFAGATAADYRDGVVAYSQAMKDADSTIKIGAVLDNNANMAVWDSGVGNWVPSATPGTAAWDTTVFTSNTAPYIDWLALHVGPGQFEERYGLYIYKGGVDYGEPSGVLYDADPPRRQLKSIHLVANTEYTFRVRALAIPSGTSRGSCPTVNMWLIPCSENSADAYNLSTTSTPGSIHVPQSDSRGVDTWAIRACNPWVEGADSATIDHQTVTAYGNGTDTRTD